MEYLIISLGSYLLGSIPFGFILTKIFLKKDIRRIGSGNIGATNALRTGNKSIAYATLILDITKAVLPVLYIKFNYPGFFVSHEGHEIETVKPILKDLNCNIAHLYFNITTKAETFGKHKDVMDVYFWQCQGATKWIIEDKDKVILNPGDLIFIPKGVHHNVIPLSPRLGVSMSNE